MQFSIKPSALPATWLIILLVGLLQLSETIYSPSLPSIAFDLEVSESMVEHTLTIYLLGSTFGILFWGRLSDNIGRKPCILSGLIVYIIGCIGCYLSKSIELLLISRFIQAFGGSIGSVLGQAICRDAFHGQELTKVYSTIGAALALFPAIGPVVGGLIAQNFGWPNIFIFLIVFVTIVTILVAIYLPETHLREYRKPIPISEIIQTLLKDKKVIGLCLVVGGCNGINFSYYAEGSFYLISMLDLSASQYGTSFLGIALFTMLGGIASTKLQRYYTPQTILLIGLAVILLSTTIFSIFIMMTLITSIPKILLIIITISSQMFTMFGFCVVTSNALALALIKYKWCIGTASSLFGFMYFTFACLIVLGIGILHNGTLYVMPLYLLANSIFMIFIYKIMIHNSKNQKII